MCPAHATQDARKLYVRHKVIPHKGGATRQQTYTDMHRGTQAGVLCVGRVSGWAYVMFTAYAVIRRSLGSCAGVVVSRRRGVLCMLPHHCVCAVRDTYLFGARPFICMGSRPLPPTPACAFETHAKLAQRWEHWLAECNACLSALRWRSVQCLPYGGVMCALLSVNLGHCVHCKEFSLG